MAEGVDRRVPAFPPRHAGTPHGYDTWDDYYDDHLAPWRQEDAVRGLKALRLAPSLLVAQALLAGQDVPAEALDPRWRRRYSL